MGLGEYLDVIWGGQNRSERRILERAFAKRAKDRQLSPEEYDAMQRCWERVLQAGYPERT